MISGVIPNVPMNVFYPGSIDIGELFKIMESPWDKLKHFSCKNSDAVDGKPRESHPALAMHSINIIHCCFHSK